jgi:2'-5' RNA ligase
MKRIFLALKAQIDDYDKLQSDFEGLIKGRWVPDENLHITVCYFGDAYSVDELLQKMPPLSGKIETLELNSLGYFEHNSILYAKIKSQKLDMIQSSISTIFSLANSKPFIGHVTLMRIKKIEDKEAFKQTLNSYENKIIGRVESRFELMQSHIEHPGGARYESIRKY